MFTADSCISRVTRGNEFSNGHLVQKGQRGWNLRGQFLWHRGQYWLLEKINSYLKVYIFVVEVHFHCWCAPIKQVFCSALFLFGMHFAPPLNPGATECFVIYYTTRILGYALDFSTGKTSLWNMASLFYFPFFRMLYLIFSRWQLALSLWLVW